MMAPTSRVLVVDDNSMMRTLVRLALRSDPTIRVDEVDCGAAALAKIALEPPDLLILDVMMPDMDGYEVCRRLREGLCSSRIPVLMLTALISDEARAKGFAAGADDFMVKPFHHGELRARAQALIHRPTLAIGA